MDELWVEVRVNGVAVCSHKVKNIIEAERRYKAWIEHLDRLHEAGVISHFEVEYKVNGGLVWLTREVVR